MPVTAIIPALNEAERIAATIDAARAAGVAEVILADGGSGDGTVEIARAHGATILTGESMRSRQLNRGAELASHECVVFLHADTLLPLGAAVAIERALESGAAFGGFRLEFIEPALRLRCVAFMINARTRLTHAPWGDQAQFGQRDVRYPELPIMEDYELARRMKKRAVILPLTVRTSGRRFLQKGVIRTSCINWLVIAGYHLGVSTERLARWYRG